MLKTAILPKPSKILSAALLASAIMTGQLSADYVVSSDQTQSGTVVLEDSEQFILTNDATLTGLDDASIFSNRSFDSGFILQSGTIDNVLLSGETSLTKTTDDRAVLIGVADYTGSTYITDGILDLQTNDALKASAGVSLSGGSVLWIGDTQQEFDSLTIADGALLGNEGAVVSSRNGFVVNKGVSYAILADAPGARAALYKSGDDVFQLAAQNRYSGPTIVAGGTLSAAFTNYALPDVSAVQLAQGATLDISNSTQYIGSLADYGEIIEDDGYSFVDMTDAWLFTGYDNTDTTFSGIIWGSRSYDEEELSSGIWKIGNGTWTLNGEIFNVGGVFNESGAFFNNGSIDAEIVKNKIGAVFGGSGWVSTFEFINAGTLLPGTESDPDFMVIYGNFRQESTGNLVVRIRSYVETGMLFVDGDAFLDGKLTLAFENGYRASVREEFDVFASSGEITGGFSDIRIANRRTMLRPYLTVRQESIEPGPGDDIILLDAPEPEIATILSVRFEQESFGKIPGLTPNQRAVGQALDSAVRRGELGRLIDGLNEADYNDIPTALSILSPEQLTAIYQIGFANSRIQFNNIERRLDDARRGVTGFSANGLALKGGPSSDDARGLSLAGFDGKSLVNKNPVAPILEESRWSFFATGTGEWADIETTNQARGSEFSTGGVTVGADYRVNDNLIVGLAGSYVHTGSDLWDGGRIKLDGGKGAVFATLFNENAWLNASVGGAYNSYDTRRSLGGSMARGKTEGGEFDALLGGGYVFNSPCGFRFGPVASLEYVYLGLNSFQEDGSPAPLAFPSQHQDSLRSALGVQASYDWSVGGVVITPEVRVRWAHEYLDSTSAVVSRFVGASSTFRVDGPSIGRDSLLVDAGASVQINPTWAVYANYSGELFRTNYSSNSVSGGFRVSF